MSRKSLHLQARRYTLPRVVSHTNPGSSLRSSMGSQCKRRKFSLLLRKNNLWGAFHLHWFDNHNGKQPIYLQHFEFSGLRTCRIWGWVHQSSISPLEFNPVLHRLNQAKLSVLHASEFVKLLINLSRYMEYLSGNVSSPRCLVQQILLIFSLRFVNLLARQGALSAYDEEH